MLTVSQLHAAMSASGRLVKRRTLKDWWTNGLLPRPDWGGRGKGQGKGRTEGFWVYPGIVGQARLAHDLLEEHRSFDTAIRDLWLQRHRVDIKLVREAWDRLIEGHLTAMNIAGAENSDEISEVVAELAPRVSRAMTRTFPSTTETRHARTDLISEFLSIFYGLPAEETGDTLAELWQTAEPKQMGWTDTARRNEFFAILLIALTTFLQDKASLTAQRRALSSASDYEFVRARRLVHVVLHHLGRMARSNQTMSVDQTEIIGRRVLRVFGPSAVLILIAVLRENSSRQKVISSVPKAAHMLRSTNYCLPVPPAASA
jgi:hypothetical protein